LAGATGCGDSSSGDSARSVASVTTTKRNHHRPRQPKPKHKRRHDRSAGASTACPAPSRTLRGVYHPSRLVVLNPCQYAAGIVADVRDEEDGDLHVIVRLDAAYKRLLDTANYSQQHADLVVE